MKTLIYGLFGIVLGHKTVVRGVGWLALVLLLSTGCATTERKGTILTPQVEYVR